MKRCLSVLAVLAVWGGLGIFNPLPAGEKKHTISFETPPQAQIVGIDYYLKVLKEFAGGKPAVHFEVKIKNLSDKPERFSVMVSAPDGTSAAGFVPARAKKPGGLPVLEPKEEGKITIPLLTEQMAESFAVVVEAVPVE